MRIFNIYVLMPLIALTVAIPAAKHKVFPIKFFVLVLVYRNNMFVLKRS